MENLSTIFQKQTNKKQIKSLSFITRFKIEVLLPFTGCRKVLGKMSDKYQNNSPYCSYFFLNFPSFNSRVFIFFVFCISSNKMNSISCGICLSFKSSQLELFCKIIIQLSSTDIFLGLWSRGSPCNFTEQLFFLRSFEWLLPIL